MLMQATPGLRVSRVSRVYARECGGRCRSSEEGLLSACEQAQLGLLVPHQHHVKERRAAGDLLASPASTFAPVPAIAGRKRCNRPWAFDDRSGPVAQPPRAQPEQKANSSPTSACRRGTPQIGAQQPDHDRVVAGRASLSDALGVVAQDSSVDRGGRGRQHRPSGASRGFACLLWQLDGGEPEIHPADELEVHAVAGAGGAMGTRQGKFVRQRLGDQRDRCREVQLQPRCLRRRASSAT
jgi:hypothetical protein